ncbi:unnamed protein product, partial [marine sediment metagenome]
NRANDLAILLEEKKDELSAISKTSRNEISNMKSALETAGDKISEFENKISNTNSTISSKDEEISNLNEEVSKSNASLKIKIISKIFFYY